MEETRKVLDLAEISDLNLLEYYHESVLDEMLFSDDGEPYNRSGLNQNEIKAEILKRMNHE